MADIDLNGVLAAGSPVTVTASGSIGLTTIRDNFTAAWSAALAAAGVPPDRQSISFGLFSTGFTAEFVIRSTQQIVTPFQVSYIVKATCPDGGSCEAATVAAVGNPGDVVKPAETPTVFKPIIDAAGAAVDEAAKKLAASLGLDFKQVGASITAAVQLAIIAILVIGTIWLFTLSKTYRPV